MEIYFFWFGVVCELRLVSYGLEMTRSRLDTPLASEAVMYVYMHAQYAG